MEASKRTRVTEQPACGNGGVTDRSRRRGHGTVTRGLREGGAIVRAIASDETAMLDVNCRAVLELAHRFGHRLADRGRGGIVMLSSIVAFQGTPYAANYAATKAYVQALAEALCVELAPRGVDVLASAPGPTRSGFAAQAGMRMARALAPADVARATLPRSAGDPPYCRARSPSSSPGRWHRSPASCASASWGA